MNLNIHCLNCGSELKVDLPEKPAYGESPLRAAIDTFATLKELRDAEVRAFILGGRFNQSRKDG